MGASRHIVGIKPPDERWKQMKAVWDACKEAGIDAPASVHRFFNNDIPDDSGVVVEMEKHHSASLYNGDGEGGFEVDVSKLPADVKIIRFYNAW